VRAQLDSWKKRLFANYYGSGNNLVSPPNFIEKREFGFILLERRVMIRHKGFIDFEGLKRFLASTAPSDAYYSAAYYEQPEADMENKSWLGADLVFDIDADHIPAPCGKVHDTWICSNCGLADKGPSPENCPDCGASKFEAKTWTCDVCLDSAKKETAKLLDMLRKDFGFTAHEMRVYFSGNRGYHVHVENKGIRELDSMARKEIVDYIIGLGLKAEFHELIAGDRIRLEPESTSWKARIVRGVERLLTEDDSALIENLGLSRRSAAFLVTNREGLLESLETKQWLKVKGVGVKNWKRIIHWVVDQQSAKIDTVVTTDIHRLIRLAGSLHGKTGFMKAHVPFNGLGKFDPLKEAIAFKEGEAVVDIVETPEFRIGDTVYGPFKNASHIELPTAAAVFLLCKGAARVVE
jgi:DNA primase small subunit